MDTYHVQSGQCELQVYSIGNVCSKISIVFLHGGPGSGAHAIMELPAFQRLSEDYHCIYFDQRGCGDSYYDLKLGLSLEDISKDVLSIIKDAKERFKDHKMILWGGSFGGYLASLCLERFSEEFEGCILSSPVLLFNRKQSLDFFERTRQIYMKRLQNNIENLHDIPENVFKSVEMQEFVWSESNPSQSLKHMSAMSSWFYQHYFQKAFEDLSIPVLILQGKDDPICDYHCIDDYMKTLKYSKVEYHLYDCCGHEVFKDKEKEFILEINKFMRRNILC